MSVQPNYHESLKFLRQWSLDRWVLTAIAPDRKGIVTQTFGPNLETELMGWLAFHGKDKNIYFHVNPVMRDLTKKAERADIKEVAWFHVDIDPRVGEDVNEEQQRALRLLQNPPESVPAPSVIIFSGGGYQGFWKLSTPIEVGGDVNKAEETARYNLQLEVLFGADNCHNVDRIMRLPGTVNRPDAKKRKKGRTEALATVIEFDDSRVYENKQFVQAQKVQKTDAGSGFNAHTVQVSGNIARLDSVEDLPEKVGDRCKVVIVQGNDPDDPHKLPSRSDWLFYVCCELVRSDVDDDTIYSVITDPQFRISDSVLDKGSGAEAYALRQIERAREDAIDPHLRIMNEKFAVIGSDGGKCRVISEVLDENMDPPRVIIDRQSFEDVRNRYMHIDVDIGPNSKGVMQTAPLGAWWLKHRKRRQFDRIVFSPDREIEGCYNLWRGFACEAKPGDCTLFLEHIKENVCAGNEDHYKYLIGWMANLIQHPGQPGFSAIVMRGRMGTGKSFVGSIFGSLLGRHYLTVSQKEHLTGKFNYHLQDCVLLMVEEAFFAGDKAHESVLKSLITDQMLSVEGKFINVQQTRSCLHIMMSSNENWVVPVSEGDRRFFVLDVNDSRRENHAYFKRIKEQMDNGGREALLHYLRTYDLVDFNVRKVPKTKALQQQKLYSMSPEEEWWYDKLQEGIVIGSDEVWETEICTKHMLNDYISYMQRFNVPRRGNSTRLSQFIKRASPNGLSIKQRRQAIEVRLNDGTMETIQRPYFYKLGTLDECRSHWDKHFGGPFEWPEVDQAKENEENIPI